jgi:hypothetical protein
MHGVSMILLDLCLATIMKTIVFPRDRLKGIEETTRKETFQ